MNTLMQCFNRFTRDSLVFLTLAAGVMAPMYSVAQACQNYEEGNTYFGINEYIEYRAGSLPIVISVPHGGYLTPSDISDRNCANCTYVNDAYTLELGELLHDAIIEISGCAPHMVMNHLDRIKLDANRNLTEGADGDPLAEQAWYDFHHFIDESKACVSEEYGAGFYLDLHGHGHSIQRIEYGYLLYEDELAFSDDVLNSSTYINYSSLRNLANTNIMGLSHVELLRGPNSLGTMLANNGYPGVPSTSDPYPLVGQPYFSGGYNTVRHSSYQGGTIDGVQVECNQSIRFDPEARDQFAVELAHQLLDFVNTFYPFEAGGCTVSAVAETTDAPSSPIYPNPGTSFLRLPADVTPCELRVYRTDGALVYHIEQMESSEVNCRDFPSGVYRIQAWKEGVKVASWTWVKHG